MTIATLAGVAVARARVTLGSWGAWYAGIDLVEDTEISGTVELKIAGLECTCTILSGGAINGRASYNVVGGFGGWGRSIPEKGYADDSGVKVASVIGDAAASAGETVADLPSTRLGVNYARRNAPAGHVLNALTPAAWHVDLEGVTRCTAWPSSTYTGDAPRVREDTRSGLIDLAVEDLTGLVPGVVVDDNDPATDVEWILTPDRLIARVYYSPRRARRLQAYSDIADALDPRREYRCPHEFRVVVQTGERFDLQPVRTGLGMPALQRVQMRPGVAGARNDVTLGSNVLVQFIEADPSRPVVTHHDAPDEPGWMPLSIELGGPAALAAARQTDTVVAGPYAGTITGGSARVRIVT